MFVGWVRRAGMLEVVTVAEDGALRTDLAADKSLAHKDETKREHSEQSRGAAFLAPTADRFLTDGNTRSCPAVVVGTLSRPEFEGLRRSAAMAPLDHAT
jgi:hypothetical protein